MQYDSIQGQGQGQGHEALKVGNSTIFKAYQLPPFIMEAGKWPQYLMLIMAGFLIFVLVFVSRNFEVGSK